MVNISELKERVTILKVTLSKNDNGFINRSYADIITVWCKVEQVNSVEKEVQDKEQIRNIKKFILRNITEVTSIAPEELAIRYKEKIYSIKTHFQYTSDNMYIILQGEESSNGS